MNNRVWKKVGKCVLSASEWVEALCNCKDES